MIRMVCSSFWFCNRGILSNISSTGILMRMTFSCFFWGCHFCNNILQKHLLCKTKFSFTNFIFLFYEINWSKCCGAKRSSFLPLNCNALAISSTDLWQEYSFWIHWQSLMFVVSPLMFWSACQHDLKSLSYQSGKQALPVSSRGFHLRWSNTFRMQKKSSEKPTPKPLLFSPPSNAHPHQKTALAQRPASPPLKRQIFHPRESPIPSRAL